MELITVTEAAKLMNQTNVKLTDAEKEFVVQFAFRTEDAELTNKLIDELSALNKDSKAVLDNNLYNIASKMLPAADISEAKSTTNYQAMSKKIFGKYETMIDFRPDWIKKIENLLVALELYRVQEEIAIKSLSEILTAYGISLSEEELMTTDIKEIKTRLKKEASL